MQLIKLKFSKQLTFMTLFQILVCLYFYLYLTFFLATALIKIIWIISCIILVYILPVFDFHITLFLWLVKFKSLVGTYSFKLFIFKHFCINLNSYNENIQPGPDTHTYKTIRYTCKKTLRYTGSNKQRHKCSTKINIHAQI